MATNLGELDSARKFVKSLEESSQVLFQKRNGARTYFVISDTLTEAEEDILKATGIPRLYEEVNGRVCKKVSAKEVTRIMRHPVTGVKCFLYEVEVEFSDNITANNQQDGNSTEDEDDPLDRRPQYTWDSETLQERVSSDIEGNLLRTPVGERIYFERKVIIPILSISYYAEFPFDPDIILEYTDHINDAIYRGAPRGAALVRKVSTTSEIVGKELYDKVTWQIAFRLKKLIIGEGYQEDSWVESYDLQGYQYLDADGNIRVNKINGERVKLNLNLDGTARDPEDDPIQVPVPVNYYADLSVIPQIN